MKKILLANEKKVQRGHVITINELSGELSNLLYCQGIECYKVTESFLKQGKTTYILRGLECEIESGYVCFSDCDQILLDNTHVLLMFLKKSIRNLYKIKAEDANDEMDYYKLQFEDGFIEIHPINE